MTAPVRRQTIPRAVGQNRQRARSLEFAVPNGHFEWKMFDDEDVIFDKTYTFMVARDLDGYVLSLADAFVVLPASIATITIEVTLFVSQNVVVNVPMLTTPIIIDPGGYTSCNTPGVVDYPNAVVSACDLVQVACSLDTSGNDAEGLGIVLEFSPT